MATTAVLLVVGVLVAEGATSAALLGRAFASVQRPGVETIQQSVHDTLLGWHDRPDFVSPDNFGPGIALTTNRDGLRIHRPVTAALAPGERRIVCIGGSFAFGSGVSDADTYCARLEQELPGVRTLNAGQRGYGVDQAYLWYLRDGGRYPHQTLLVGISGANLDRLVQRETAVLAYPKPTLALRDGRLVPENVPVPQWAGWSRWSASTVLIPELRTVQLIRRSVDVSDAAQYQRSDEKVWPLVEAVFRDFGRVSRERGAELVVAYLPVQEEYVPTYRDARRERLAAFARSAGIRFVDLTPALREIPADTMPWMYITPNALPVNGVVGHYTVMGNRWAAQTLARQLADPAGARPTLAADPRVSTLSMSAVR